MSKLLRRSRVVNIVDRNNTYIHFSMYNTEAISKYRIFFFETMRDAQLSDIRMVIQQRA